MDSVHGGSAQRTAALPLDFLVIGAGTSYPQSTSLDWDYATNFLSASAFAFPPAASSRGTLLFTLHPPKFLAGTDDER